MATERMLKYIEKYTGELKELGEKNIDSELLENLVRRMSGVIWDRDKANVAASDPEELKTVSSWAQDKLDVTDAKVMPVIDEICVMMKGDRTKSRVVFYYLICKKMGKSL